MPETKKARKLGSKNQEKVCTEVKEAGEYTSRILPYKRAREQECKVTECH